MTNISSQQMLFRHGLTRRAFTLVELLVVIAITALLISLLLPALKQSRNVATLIKCKINLQQIGIATEMYLNDYKEWYPPLEPSASPTTKGSIDKLFRYGGRYLSQAPRCPDFHAPESDVNWGAYTAAGYITNAGLTGYHRSDKAIPTWTNIGIDGWTPTKRRDVPHPNVTILHGDGLQTYYEGRSYTWNPSAYFSQRLTYPNINGSSSISVKNIGRLQNEDATVIRYLHQEVGGPPAMFVDLHIQTNPYNASKDAAWYPGLFMP